MSMWFTRSPSLPELPLAANKHVSKQASAVPKYAYAAVGFRVGMGICIRPDHEFFFGPCTSPGSRKLLTQPTAEKKSDDQA